MGPPASRTFEILIPSHVLARCRIVETVVAHPLRRDNRRASRHVAVAVRALPNYKGKSSRLRRRAVRSYAASTKENSMFQQVRFFAPAPLRVATALGVAACGGGNSMMPATSQAQTSQMNQMRLSVADAPPADNATHVVVVFTGVELTGNSGNPVTITFPTPKSIDLMTQSNTASAVLFDQPIPAGSYGQIRLMVMADGAPSNSYLTLSDGTMHGLQVPSGSETGLKLVSGFTVPSSGVVDYTIDFYLTKATPCPPGKSPACILKPVERLVDNTTV